MGRDERTLGVLTCSTAVYACRACLLRIDASGALLGTDDFGDSTWSPGNLVLADIVPADGKFLLSRRAAARYALRSFAADGGALGAEVIVTASRGNPDLAHELAISPTHAYVAWTEGISARMWSDLGPVTGAYYQRFAVFNPGPISVVIGLVIGSTTHNGSTVITGRLTCH